MEYEAMRKEEKIPVEFPKDWINKLKHRLIQTVKYQY